MRNYLLISAVFPPEPVVSAKLSNDIADALSKKNTVSVISPKPSRPFGFQFTGEKLQFSFTHILLASYVCASSSIKGRFKESYSFGKHCYRYITKHHQNIDVIYANTWPLLGQYFAVKAARKYNIPILIHVQDIYPESLTNKLPFLSPILNLLLLPIDKYVLRRATKVIAISEKMKAYLIKTRKLQSNQVFVVSNWQDEEIFTAYQTTNKHISSKNTPFTFMYLGNMGPVAGVEMLMDAFAQADLKNCRLILAGSGSMKGSLQKKAAIMNHQTIEFWEVPEGKVPEIQDQADVMLLPIMKGAAGSSIPSKLPAYMFSAKPIIACVDADSDTANAITTADCGWVLAPEDSDQLIMAMNKSTVLPVTELEQKGRNGFEFAIEHFSKQHNLEKLCAIINETIPTCTTEK